MTIIKNSYTRLWFFFDKPEGLIKRIYVPTVMIWRVMMDANTARIILRSRGIRNGKFNLIQDFEQGGRIECHYGTCGDPSRYDPMAMVAFFHECMFRRVWIGPMGALSASGVDTIEQWLEVESKKWRLEF